MADKMTLESLEKAKRAKEDIIAKLYLQLAELEKKKEQRNYEYHIALRADDYDKYMELARGVSEIDLEKKVIADRIELVNQDQPYTDQDVIDAANTEAAADIANLQKMKMKYHRAATELGILVHDMAELYMSISQKRQKCLSHHSKYNFPRADNIFSEQGLIDIPQLPSLNGIRGLLEQQFGGDETGAMIAISAGAYVPGFIEEEEKEG